MSSPRRETILSYLINVMALALTRFAAVCVKLIADCCAAGIQILRFLGYLLSGLLKIPQEIFNMFKDALEWATGLVNWKRRERGRFLTDEVKVDRGRLSEEVSELKQTVGKVWHDFRDQTDDAVSCVSATRCRFCREKLSRPENAGFSPLSLLLLARYHCPHCFEIFVRVDQSKIQWIARKFKLLPPAATSSDDAERDRDFTTREGSPSGRSRGPLVNPAVHAGRLQQRSLSARLRRPALASRLDSLEVQRPAVSAKRLARRCVRKSTRRKM